MSATGLDVFDRTLQITHIWLNELMEDISDLAAVAERREEPTRSHEQVLEELKRDGLLQD